MSTASVRVTPQQLQQFRDDGYFILERALPDELLRIAREECQRFIERENKLMDSQGTDVHGLSRRNSRYFVSNCFKDQPRLRQVLFSRFFADLCRQTIGDTAYLFWEQYVVKGAEIGEKFSWHQDSGYVGYPDHKPYLTCWCALDDVSEENGTVYVLPFSTIGVRTWVQHVRDPSNNDLIGYFGKERGVPIIAPAGSIAVFTSLNFHSSGANKTNQMRRVYLAQYSVEPVMTADGSRPWGNAEPLLRDGKYVGQIQPPLETASR